MRYKLAMCLLILCVLLAGCASPAEATVQVTETTAATEDTLPTEVTVPEVPAPTTPAQTLPEEELPEPAPEEPANETPYLQRIEAGQRVYQGPGYDYAYVTDVPERGIYTIVEEARDPEHNLWGKLKSGIGWVDLTEIKSEDYGSPLISADYADEGLLSGACHHFPNDDPYSIPIVFRAYGTLRDVTLFAYEFSSTGYYPGADLFTLPEMTEAMPLIAELDFPGDMTTYGIRFTDGSGNTHICRIYISGRDGALILEQE